MNLKPTAGLVVGMSADESVAALHSPTDSEMKEMSGWTYQFSTVSTVEKIFGAFICVLAKVRRW